LVSEERADWLAKLESITLESEEMSSLTGMERWFTLPDRSVTQAPPKYKSAVLVFLGLYPLVLVLNLLSGPLTGSWPAALRILVSLVVSVPLMVWVIMPQLTRLFFGWLYPEHTPSRLTRDES
jgi:antibiotic biosynthesis monooxygenase (ABM) superfamily enzyme